MVVKPRFHKSQKVYYATQCYVVSAVYDREDNITYDLKIYSLHDDLPASLNEYDVEEDLIESADERHRQHHLSQARESHREKIVFIAIALVLIWLYFSGR